MVHRLLGDLKQHETRQSARAAAPLRISTPKDENSQRDRTHIATMMLVYLTRCKLGKQKLAEHGGIEILVRMVNGEGFTSESKAQSLQLLWNEVYLREHKKLMVDNGIIDDVMKYVKDPMSQLKGIKCAFFLMSHLAHAYPERVYESGIVQEGMARMSEFETPINPTDAQTLEGICRLIWSLTLTETTRRSLSTPATVQALLRSLNIDRDLDSSRMCSRNDSQVLGAPNDAHKMRAAAALDKLAEHDPEASNALDALLLKCEASIGPAPAGAEGANEAEGAHWGSTGILWLGVQPHVNQMIRKRPHLVNLLKNKLNSDEFCEDVKSYDVIILLLGTMDSSAQLKDLSETPIRTPNGTMALARYMHSVWDQEGHSM